MTALFDLIMFALDRMRTVLVALSLIVLLKAVLLCVVPAAG